MVPHYATCQSYPLHEHSPTFLHQRIYKLSLGQRTHFVQYAKNFLHKLPQVSHLVGHGGVLIGWLHAFCPRGEVVEWSATILIDCIDTCPVHHELLHALGVPATHGHVERSLAIVTPRVHVTVPLGSECGWNGVI